MLLFVGPCVLPRIDTHTRTPDFVLFTTYPTKTVKTCGGSFPPNYVLFLTPDPSGPGLWTGMSSPDTLIE